MRRPLLLHEDLGVGAQEEAERGEQEEEEERQEQEQKQEQERSSRHYHDDDDDGAASSDGEAVPVGANVDGGAVRGAMLHLQKEGGGQPIQRLVLNKQFRNKNKV